jgi:VanZ family protein
VKRILWLWAPPLAYAGLIFFLSSREVPEVLAPPGGLDKLLHLAEYAVLGALLSRALLGTGAPGTILWAGLLGAVYGITDELHQYFVPSRSAEGLDALADALGSFLGAWLYARVARLAAGAVSR